METRSLDAVLASFIGPHTLGAVRKEGAPELVALAAAHDWPPEAAVFSVVVDAQRYVFHEDPSDGLRSLAADTVLVAAAADPFHPLAVNGRWVIEGDAAYSPEHSETLVEFVDATGQAVFRVGTSYSDTHYPTVVFDVFPAYLALFDAVNRSEELEEILDTPAAAGASRRLRL